MNPSIANTAEKMYFRKHPAAFSVTDLDIEQ